MSTKKRPPEEALSHEYEPMEMLAVKEIPVGEEWLYEPKWDGFRCLAFCEDGEIDLRSKNANQLGRYFPEVIEALKKLEVQNFVIDGELMIWHGTKPSFDDLLQRIHPAASRVKTLSTTHPATFLIFDMLMDEDGELLNQLPLTERREKLEEFARKNLKKNNQIALSPITDDIDNAKLWMEDSGVSMDGVIAKRADLPYQSGNRNGAVKVKREHTVDCVIGGFRYGSNSKEVASVLLGLYDSEGELHHVGFSSAFSSKERDGLTKKLEPLKTDQSFTKNIPGGPSRWSGGKEKEWVPIKPELVVEIKFDHLTNGRFRHGTKILRWRDDKKPRKCTFDQLGELWSE